jgi:hypothetical protein
MSKNKELRYYKQNIIEWLGIAQERDTTKEKNILKL